MPTTVYFRDKVAGKFRLCAGDCGRYVLPPKRKCPHCKKQKKYRVIDSRPIMKGKNARGTCLHKPDKVRTKRAKRQNLPNGAQGLRKMKLDPAKAIGTKKDQERNK